MGRDARAKQSIMGSKQTQYKIKQSAIMLFNKRGTGRVSTNLIAEHSGISKGNLYYHFKNKQEIIQAIHADIVAEMNEGWYEDQRQPTVTHMAEMFVRQLDLIWRYRFLYREMVTLIRNDSTLREQMRQNRERRIEAVIDYFETLVDAGILIPPRSKQSLRYLVIMTWIFCDNWLNFIELQGKEDDDVLQLGYDFIIEVLYPNLTDSAKQEILSSYSVLQNSNSIYSSKNHRAGSGATADK